jgi:predicted phage tail protein
MTITLKTLAGPVQISGATTTQYTTPLGTKTIIDKATVTNTDVASRAFSVHLVPSGGTASNSNLLINTRAVAVGETYMCPELIGQILTNGDFLQTFASAGAALTLRISGREVT